jgi:hypothetical protein
MEAAVRHSTKQLWHQQFKWLGVGAVLTSSALAIWAFVSVMNGRVFVFQDKTHPGWWLLDVCLWLVWLCAFVLIIKNLITSTGKRTIAWLSLGLLHVGLGIAAYFFTFIAPGLMA